MDTYIYLPRGDAKKAELAKRVSAMHAAFVFDYINSLHCSNEQKLQLIDELLALGELTKTEEKKENNNGQP